MIRRLLFLACAVLFVEAFFSQVLTPLVPGYRRDLGLGGDATGILVASYSAGALLLAIPAGWFASRYNPRNSVIVGLVGVGVSSVLFGFADQVAWLDASRFLLGAFGALMWAGGIAWMISATPLASRGTVMGTLVAASVAGELLGSPIGALAGNVGTEVVFSLMLVVALALVVLARTVEPVAEHDGQGLRAAWSVVAGDQARNWVVALSAIVGPATAIGFVMVILPLRLDDLGVSAWWIAGAFTGMSLIEAVGGPVVGRVSDRVGRKAPYLVGLALAIAPLVVLGAVDSVWGIGVALVVISVGCAMAFTTSFTLVTDLATASGLNQAYSAAASNIGWSASIIIGAVGGGVIIGATGYVAASVVVTAFGVLIGVVCATSPFPRVTSEDTVGVAA